MKKNFYLIDTENVGDRWMDFINGMGESDVLVVFYSRNHSKLLEETYLRQRYNKRIRWIECLTGSNALDHQLMGVLSYLVATNAEATYAICSNDLDYQNVIDFWEQRGVEIGRVGFDTRRKGCQWQKQEAGEELLPKHGQEETGGSGQTRQGQEGRSRGSRTGCLRHAAAEAAGRRLTEQPDQTEDEDSVSSVTGRIREVTVPGRQPHQEEMARDRQFRPEKIAPGRQSRPEEIAPGHQPRQEESTPGRPFCPEEIAPERRSRQSRRRAAAEAESSFSPDTNLQPAEEMGKGQILQMKVPEELEGRGRRRRRGRSGVQAQECTEERTIQPLAPEEMTDQQIITEIARSIPVSDLGSWYTVLVSLVGQDAGLEYYRKLKKDAAWRDELSRYLLPNAQERNVYLIALLYRYHHLDAAKAAEAYRLVDAHNRKNKKAIRADFEKHFGWKTEEQNRYYKVLKPVVDVLKGK